MANINLSKGMTALIDDEDCALVADFSWYARRMRAGDNWYAVGTYAGGQQIYMHRLILGAAAGQQIDHINRDGLDNRRENLRFCTSAQNAANRIMPVGASGFRGVEIKRDKFRTTPYRARLNFQRRTYFGSHHSDAVMAAREYDALAKKHFGEFAVLNFPDE